MGLKRINWVCSELIKKGRNKKENIAIIQIENQEALNIWKSLEQAENNCEGLTPLLIFKRNKSKIYAALEIEDFLNLLDGNK